MRKTVACFEQTVSLRQLENHLPFQVISVLHDKKRPATNRVFGKWSQIFADNAGAHTIFHSLAERTEVLRLEETTYRETYRRLVPKAAQPWARGPLRSRDGRSGAHDPRVIALFCLSPPTPGHIDRGDGDAHHAEM